MHLAAVIGVDRARRIEHRNTEVQRQPGARPDLSLSPSGEREGEAGRNGGTPARSDDHRSTRRHRGDEVEPSRVRALIGRQRQVGGVRAAAA
jgi:hypothetical protein